MIQKLDKKEALRFAWAENCFLVKKRVQIYPKERKIYKQIVCKHSKLSFHSKLESLSKSPQKWT